MTPRGWRWWLRAVVGPIVGGLAVGAVVAALPNPWPGVILGLGFVALMVLVLVVERDVRRMRRCIAELDRAVTDLNRGES